MYNRAENVKQKSQTPLNPAVSRFAFHTPIFLRCTPISRFILSLCFISSPTLAPAVHAEENSYDQLISVTAGSALSHARQDARGVLKAGEKAIIASSMTARLIKAGYKPGQSFKRGALLAQFDCAQQEAELSALTQAHETLTLKYQNQDHLFKAGAAGQLDVSVAQSEMQQAAAEREALKARLKHCRVYAPYSGVIVEKHIAAYETPAQNAPLYTVHKAGPLEISIIIPSKWLRWLEKGDRFTFKVDETGSELTGKVSRIGAAVDPVSQTIEITGQTMGSVGASLSGMSGIAIFKKESAS